MIGIHLHHITIYLIPVLANGKWNLTVLVHLYLLGRLDPSNHVWMRMFLNWKFQLPHNFSTNDIFKAPTINN